MKDVIISIKNLYKSYDKPVLRGVNLDILKGETMVIIGESGCGKSQVLKHLIKLIEADSGEIIVDGVDIVKASKREFKTVKRKMGMLFQGGALFDSMNVGENIAFPLRENFKYSKEQIEAIIKDKLELVGLEENIKHKMASELSGGMQKRVALARAVAMEPEILMYDEPTTGLDPITSDKINDLIIDMKLKLHVTSIVVTHDMNSAYKIADRIAFLYKGEIMVVGTPEEIKYSKDIRVQQFVRGIRDIEKLKLNMEEEKLKEQFNVNSLYMTLQEDGKKSQEQFNSMMQDYKNKDE